jgi:hypothetical protein
VAEAVGGAVMFNEPALCGRPTRRGKPCRAYSCALHLTSQERVERARKKAEQDVHHARWDLYYASPPACHSWDRPAKGQNSGAWQDGRCAGCGLSRAWLTLEDDHCHLTGLCRGYLCSGCNQDEGRNKRAARWQMYRQWPPTLICGDMTVYRSWGTAEPQWWVQLALGSLPDTCVELERYYYAAHALVRNPWTGRARATAEGALVLRLVD